VFFTNLASVADGTVPCRLSSFDGLLAAFLWHAIVTVGSSLITMQLSNARVIT
jgi:hypothetical protein